MKYMVPKGAGRDRPLGGAQASKADGIRPAKKASRLEHRQARKTENGKAPRAAGMLLAAAVSGGANAAGVIQQSLVYKTTSRGPLHVEVVKPAQPSPAAGWPCAVFFHGGGWRGGSARQFVPFSTVLAQRGVMGLSVEYRLLRAGDGETPNDAVRDARSAMRWVRKNAAQLGCDTRRIAAGGGSSGGHLAMMTAMKTSLDDPTDDLRIDPRPAALLVLNAPLNFDDYASAVPLAERRKLSPHHLLDATLPPLLILQGTADKVVPYKQVTDFRDKAKALGVRDLTLIPFEGRTHGFFNKGKGEPGDFDAAAQQMTDFLHRLGWLEKP